MTTPRRTTIALVSGATVVAALAACSDAAAMSDVRAEDSSSATVDEQGESAPADASTSGYTDGTYTETGTYQSPNGEESVQVSVSLEDGLITAVEVTPGATNPTSKRYQTAFASGIADEVVGKSITETDVDVVSGSSLTSAGFNAALAQIASDAQA